MNHRIARALRVVSALAVAAVIAGTMAAPASAYSGSTTWTYGSVKGYVTGSATASCSSGLVTAKCYWNNPYVYVYKQSGSNVDKAQGAQSMSFGYVTGSVSSAPGVSVSSGTKSCSDSYDSATGKTSVSGQYSGTACTSSSYLATWVGGYSVTGKLRIGGTSWTSKLLTIK